MQFCTDAYFHEKLCPKIHWNLKRAALIINSSNGKYSNLLNYIIFLSQCLSILLFDAQIFLSQCLDILLFDAHSVFWFIGLVFVIIININFSYISIFFKKEKRNKRKKSHIYLIIATIILSMKSNVCW